MSEPSKSDKTSNISLNALPPSLADSIDPQKFKLDPPNTGKITKDNFETKTGMGLASASQAKDPNDPLSGLDPLWSLKNNKP